jgi:hypothetical protein
MDGIGNFNWRFVHEFAYFPAEQCISVKRKEHFWSYSATEYLLPPVFNLQIWDNDKFTPDDFLGRTCVARCHASTWAVCACRCADAGLEPFVQTGQGRR